MDTLLNSHNTSGQDTAKHNADNLRPGINLYSWVEKGTICVWSGLYNGWY